MRAVPIFVKLDGGCALDGPWALDVHPQMTSIEEIRCRLCERGLHCTSNTSQATSFRLVYKPTCFQKALLLDNRRTLEDYCIPAEAELFVQFGHGEPSLGCCPGTVVRTVPAANAVGVDLSEAVATESARARSHYFSKQMQKTCC